MKNSILNKFTSKKKTTVVFVILLIGTLAYTISTNAYPDGVSGKTLSGCTCHSSQSTTTTVTAFMQNGGNWTVTPNSTNTFIVTLHNSTYTHGGVDIGIKTTASGETNIGTLSPTSSYLKTKSSELTQTASTSYTDSLQFVFTWTAPSTPGTYYLKAAGLSANNNGGTSGDLWNVMTAQAIVVQSAASVSVTSPNGGESWCAGSSQPITWTAQSVDNVKIELSADGGNTFPTTLTASTPASAGTWSWSIPTSLAAGTNYIIRISDASNSSTSDVSNAAFSIKPVTAITQQPQTLSACVGSSPSFTVTATGVNLTYQWRKDGLNIPDGTAATYIVNSITLQSAGSYNCIVTGACGNAITSSTAYLTVDEPPSISSQPSEIRTCAGQPAVFSVTAGGSSLTYQWQKDGQNLPGKTDAQLSLTNVQAADNGEYKVIVSGKCTPPVTSQPALLTVQQSPAITTQPTDQTVTKGGTINLSITATGTNPTYQWQKTGVDIPNATQSTLTITNAKIEDSGNYHCKVTNTCGTVNSNSALVTVQDITAPILTLKNTSIDFGKIKVGSSKDSTFMGEISNTGNADMMISNCSMSGMGMSEFQIMNSSSFPKTLKPNESADIVVKFMPTSGGSKTAQINITSNATGNNTITINGFGLIADFTTSVPELNFEFSQVNVPVTQSVTILNKSNVDLTADLSITGTNPDNFAIKTDKTISLAVNGEQVSEITFTPISATDQEALLQVNSKDFGLLKTVKLVATYTTGISDNSQNIQVSIVPNPSSDGVIIRLNNLIGNNMELMVFDEIGNKIINFNQMNINNNTISWDLKDNQGRRVQNGMYNVLLIVDGKVTKKPLIILR